MSHRVEVSYRVEYMLRELDTPPFPLTSDMMERLARVFRDYAKMPDSPSARLVGTDILVDEVNSVLAYWAWCMSDKVKNMKILIQMIEAIYGDQNHMTLFDRVLARNKGNMKDNLRGGLKTMFRYIGMNPVLFPYARKLGLDDNWIAKKASK